MAVLAVAGIGAVAGLGIGAAAGLTTFAALATAASIGFSVGTLVGQQLFPEQVKQEGSRLTDLTVTSSAFGAVRPIVYGQVRIAGNIIWSTPIREQKNTQKHGKGGSGPSVTNTTYTYFGSFAIALCEGPIDAVLRIWADSKLIYDSTGPQLIQQKGVNFRFYPGDEEQLADSIIQADKGVENVPAYRGTCYIVFDNLPLADYGNRLPNITCEVVERRTPAFPYQTWTEFDPTIVGGDAGAQGTPMGVDWDRNLLYFQGSDPFTLIVADAVTLRTIREVPMTEVLSDGTDGGYSIKAYGPNIFVGPDGALYFESSPGIIRVDQNTLKQTAVFHLTGAFNFPQFLASISTFTPEGARKDYLVEFGFFSDWRVLSMPDLVLQASGVNADSAEGLGGTTGKWGVGFGEAWGLWGPGALGGPHLFITRVRLDGLTFTNTTMATFTVDQFDPAALIFLGADRKFLVYDQTDDSLIINFTTAHDIAHGFTAWVVKWSAASGIVWKTDLTAAGVSNAQGGPSAEVNGQSRLTQGTFAWFTVGGLVQISTATGAVLINQTAAPASGGWPIGLLNSIQVYDSETQIVAGGFNENLAGVSVPGSIAKAFIARRTGLATTLGEIVSDQCQRAGFEAADFDVSTLTDVIEGYVVSQRATVTDVLTPLLGAFIVDAVETDYTLRFKHRAGATVASIVQDDLIRTDQQSAEPYVETRQQEIELPMRLTITYIDKDRDYQMNTAAVKRIRNPDPTVFSDNQVDVQLAAVMTSTPGKKMAEMLLYTAWNERHTFAARLSPAFDYLDAADAVQLTLNDGYTARVRLGNISLGVDYSIETKLIGETDGQYVSLAEADPGVPWFGSHFITAAGKSELILLDTPLLRDIDDLAGRAIRGYWGGGPFSRAAAWPGAVLQEADPSSSLWTTLSSITDEATWGYVEAAPADWPPVFATQDELHGGVMTVGIIGGGGFLPSSVTDVDLANFANPIALIKSNGQVEIIQYRDAAALANGRWQLSTLRRGQRGTDTMAFGHTNGETFVFLDESLIDLLQIPLAQHNISEFYRLVTIGMIPDDANIEAFAFHGRDMMPYAPVNAERAQVGSDVVLTWIRRTRIGGMMVDGTDTVPLNEATEAYEVYLLASAADAEDFDPTVPATYLRAFLALSSATLTYTAAQMVTDGFDPATDTIYAVIYQLSAVVGRGFSTLHVLPSLGGLTLGLEDGSGSWAGWLWG
jgi:hypothetical protein